MFTKKSIVRVVSIVLVVLLMSSTASAHPLQSALGTSFTYQGKLTDGGAPANGTYDLVFKLYNALNGGSQVGSTFTWGSVPVTNGLFTVQLDFGDVFDGTALYLEISVRPGTTGAFTTLTPRQALSATPYAIYAAKAPWSGITNMPAGFADGVDNGSAYQNVKVVAKSGGDFTSIQAALDSITDASDANRYLVHVAPGVYTERVTMKQYVDIEGSGELTTKITFTGAASEDISTVAGANNAELRFLTVENTGGATDATAIFDNSVSPRLTHITANASGGTSTNNGVLNRSCEPTMTNVTASASGGASTYNVGVYNGNNSSPMMANVTASASGGEVNYGVYNEGSSPMMTNVTASASGGTTNYGVLNFSSSPTMTNVTASASGGTTNYGVNNYDYSSPTINNSVISGSGGANNYGIYNVGLNGMYTVRVNNSQISGSTNTIFQYEGSAAITTLVGASQLNGGAVSAGGGAVTCAGVYDENYTFYASTCP